MEAEDGYYICIDQSFYGDEERVARTVYKLCEKGYEKKLLFSHDRPLYNDFEIPDRLGLDYPEQAHIDRYSWLQHKVIPELKKIGCTKEECELFLRKKAVKLCIKIHIITETDKTDYLELTQSALQKSIAHYNSCVKGYEKCRSKMHTDRTKGTRSKSKALQSE